MKSIKFLACAVALLKKEKDLNNIPAYLNDATLPKPAPDELNQKPATSIEKAE